MYNWRIYKETGRPDRHNENSVEDTRTQLFKEKMKGKIVLVLVHVKIDWTKSKFGFVTKYLFLVDIFGLILM